MQHVLLPAEVQWVTQCEHGPNACTLMLSSLVKQLDLPLFRAVELDVNITRLVDFYGGCERIMKTPVPLSYTRYAAPPSQARRNGFCPLPKNPLLVHSSGVLVQ